jgi:dimethylamine/trimethylamine dehydrogenase
MSGTAPEGPVIVFDDDHYYMGSVISERLQALGREVVLVTPEAVVSAFTTYTLEQSRIQAQLMEAGVRIVASHSLVSIGSNGVEVRCTYTDRVSSLPCESVVLVTALTANDDLYAALIEGELRESDGEPRRITRIGDCYAPGTIAAAVWSGHRCAREPFAEMTDEVPFRLERVEFVDG